MCRIYKPDMQVIVKKINILLDLMQDVMKVSKLIFNT